MAKDQKHLINRKQARKKSLEYLDKLIKILTALRSYIKKDQITEEGFRGYLTKIMNTFRYANQACRVYFLSHYVSHKGGNNVTRRTSSRSSKDTK